MSIPITTSTFTFFTNAIFLNAMNARPRIFQCLLLIPTGLILTSVLTTRRATLMNAIQACSCKFQILRVETNS